MKVVSTFSGCGGSSLGYKLAGFDVEACVEFIPSAADTYKENHPNTKIILEDIRNVTGKSVLDSIGIGVGDLDILDGSPPCASFSNSGKKDKLWGVVKKYSETKQRVDDLFFEYIRLVDEIRPKIAVAENVKGLTQGKCKVVLDEIINKFDEIGYNARWEILKACDFGVAQLRPRCFIVAIRKDLDDGSFNYPTPTHDNSTYVTVKDAIEDVINNPDELKMLLDAGEKYANMQKWDEIPDVGKSHPKRFNVSRNHWNKPSFTLSYNDSLLNAAGLCHPWEKRRHTVPEMKRLMGFPDDYVLTGTWQQQVERLGRSVAPPVVQALAETLKTYLEKH